MRQTTKGQIQIGSKRYQHRGVTVVQTGIAYTVWLNYVTPEWLQPRRDTLTLATELINASHQGK